jgi:hypothetical protein
MNRRGLHSCTCFSHGAAARPQRAVSPGRADVYTTAQCGAAFQQYGITVSHTMDWGSAPSRVQRAWTASGCSWRICQFFLDERPAGLGMVPGLDWGDFRPDLQVTTAAAIAATLHYNLGFDHIHGPLTASTCAAELPDNL